MKNYQSYLNSLNEAAVSFSGILKMSVPELFGQLHQLQEQICAEHPEMTPLPEDKLHVTLIHQSVFKNADAEGIRLDKKLKKVQFPQYTGEVQLGEVKHAIDTEKGKETYIVEIANQEDLKDYVYFFIESVGGTRDMIDNNPVDANRVFHITLCNNMEGNPMGSIADTWNFIVD